MAGIRDNMQREAIEKNPEATASRGITDRIQKIDGYVASILVELAAIEEDLEADAARTQDDGQGNQVSAPQYSAATVTEIIEFVTINRDGGDGASGNNHIGLTGVVAAFDTFLAQY